MAEQIDRVLLDVVRQLEAVHRGGLPVWGPSKELAHELRRLLSNLGRL